MDMRRQMIGGLLGVGALILFVLSIPLEASSAAAFPEEGKIIQVIVPYPPGGGPDLYFRALQPFLKKYLPPQIGGVVIKNVVGGGGITGARELYFSKPDGYTIGVILTRTILFPQLLGQVVKFDMTKYTFLGQFNNFPSVYFTRKNHPILKSFSDMKNSPRTLTVAMADPGQIGGIWLLKEKMKINIKPAFGYKGSKETELAVLQGEADLCNVEFSAIVSLVRSGDIIPLLHFGDKPMREAPEIPSLKDLGYTEFAGKITVDRTIVGPPNIPKDRAGILEKSIWEALNDPDHIKLSEKAGRFLDIQNANNSKEVCLSIINFWTKYEEQIKQEMVKTGQY